MITALDGVPGHTWSTLFELTKKLDRLGVVDVETSIQRSLEHLITLSGSKSGSVIIACRVEDDNDVLRGWRPVWYYAPYHKRIMRGIRALMPLLRWTKADSFNMEKVGVPRAKAQSVADYAGHKSHVIFARFMGTGHRLNVVIPVTDHTEVFLLKHRGLEAEPYSDQDVASAVAIAHAMRPYAHRWCRWMGVLDGQLLTCRERQALMCMLQGFSEKRGAAELGIKPTSFHQIAVTIYKKMNVQSRAELISKCLSNQPEQTDFWKSRFINVGLNSKRDSKTEELQR